ncbi:hypothetical protein [Paenibacillus odorifer]|uniref:hypothetical protein n=1 Tax=Paenibacillus odorifer TaxID=189426 RepID=UPI00096DF560|nr:hypothetical protein [Paenibacillus odorifer]OMD75302.1 hypothetical protein BSK50_19065 [Paenibacillus odorifer]
MTNNELNEELQSKVKHLNEVDESFESLTKELAESLMQLADGMIEYYQNKKNSKHHAFKHNKNKIKNVGRK